MITSVYGELSHILQAISPLDSFDEEETGEWGETLESYAQFLPLMIDHLTLIILSAALFQSVAAFEFPHEAESCGSFFRSIANTFHL